MFISKRLRLPFSYQHYNDSQSQTRQYVLKIDFFILKDSIIFQIEIVSLLFVYLFFFVSLFIGLNWDWIMLKSAFRHGLHAIS